MIAILITLGLVFNLSHAIAQGKIEITIKSVTSDRGKVYINLFSNELGFPGDWSKVYQQKIFDAKKGDLRVSFDDIPFGTYAISIGHDENGNGEIDSNFIGFPKEPVGVTNQDGFGKPSFRRSKFKLSEAIKEQNFEIRFLN
ncbi:MAG: DUF2141 domain-containing protein [Bacteroidota bacterium]